MELPVEPTSGVWTCADCSIAFNKSDEIITEGDAVDSDGFLASSEANPHLFENAESGFDTPVGCCATYSEQLDDAQIEHCHDQLQAETDTNG